MDIKYHIFGGQIHKLAATQLRILKYTKINTKECKIDDYH